VGQTVLQFYLGNIAILQVYPLTPRRLFVTVLFNVKKKIITLCCLCAGKLLYCLDKL